MCVNGHMGTRLAKIRRNNVHYSLFFGCYERKIFNGSPISDIDSRAYTWVPSKEIC